MRVGEALETTNELVPRTLTTQYRSKVYRSLQIIESIKIE